MGSLSTGTDEGWDDLRGAIEQIYLGKKPLTKSRYMALYTRAMNLCRVKAFRETPRHRVAGYELYKYLKTFLSNHVTTLSNSANGLVMADDILRFYSSEWERFKSCSERLSHILPFRNVNSLKNEWPECTERLYTTYQLSLLTWRDVFLHAYGTKVRDGVLDLIENERRGGPVDISWIRSVVFSYVELGLIEIKEDPSKRQPELEVYKTAFECPFLENTERFYQRVAAKLFEQNPVSEYVKKVEQHLDEEERRVELYLHASTLKPLVRTLWEVLIQKNFKSLRSEFKNFLSEDRRDGLVNMYQLMSALE
ncbi:hypothetical protein HPB48_015515 [Haemaphysalis longicornis]|uniref:Cullin N-terminal domain-containing protein n=1 Tax=Haemaphysalis longicornis TaxID=44386 RepID=A0A9J6FI06_HAELO|nr:hypothetical protein HPB48_015515 [Haemaphysalis longicornis]